MSRVGENLKVHGDGEDLNRNFARDVALHVCAGRGEKREERWLLYEYL